jgi:hypothetical protein
VNRTAELNRTVRRDDSTLGSIWRNAYDWLLLGVPLAVSYKFGEAVFIRLNTQHLRSGADYQLLDGFWFVRWVLEPLSSTEWLSEELFESLALVGSAVRTGDI